MNYVFNEGFSFLGENRFIPLGQVTENLPGLNLASQPIMKMKKQVETPVHEIWGTLGWKDNSPFHEKGELKFSKEGNFDNGVSNGATYQLTQDHIDDIISINPDLEEGGTNQVRERYINFDEMEFTLPDTFILRELPELRLTLYLQKDEGAIVYYQHGKRNDWKDEDAFVEYILHDGKDSTSDRKTYYFPVEPKYKLEAVDEENELFRQTGELSDNSFVIKILTFKQRDTKDKDVFKHQSLKLNNYLKAKNQLNPSNVVFELVGKEKYAFLVFDPTNNTNPEYGGGFVKVENANQIVQNKKTLFLIHGTFVNTNKSFHDLLIKNGTQPSHLQSMLLNTDFEQIVALDHPTISQNAKQNAEWLYHRMDDLGICLDGVDIITTSRGALIAEYMASDPDAQSRIGTIHKVMMFSAANGCGYFTFARGLSLVLSVWKKSASGPIAKIILTIVQGGIDAFRDMEGCKQMTPGDASLTHILNTAPRNVNIKYKTVASDWDRCLVLNEKWIRRVGACSLDFLIKGILGKKHDWVIGFKAQETVPVNSHSHEKEERKSIHGRYLEAGYVKDKNCQVIADPHQSIVDFMN